MSRSPLILLPPSEGKSSGGKGPPWSTCASTPELDDHRRKVIVALRVAMRGSAAKRRKLLSLGEVAVRAATEANRAVALAPTRPAIERYTGVLFGALDQGSLPDDARQRLDTGVLMFSGLWGAVAPSDQIPDYKLKMGVGLGRLGKLSTWWRTRLGPTLDEAARGRVVWDLRPAEHSASWHIGDTPSRVIKIKFLEEQPGRGLVTVSHWNKLLKGALTRHLVTTANPTLECLADFRFEDFVWEPISTVESENRTVTNIVKRI